VDVEADCPEHRYFRSLFAWLRHMLLPAIPGQASFSPVRKLMIAGAPEGHDRSCGAEAVGSLSSAD
jgi:hypothetical protein